MPKTAFSYKNVGKNDGNNVAIQQKTYFQRRFLIGCL